MAISMRPSFGANRASALPSEGAAALTPDSKGGLERLRKDFKSLSNRALAFREQSKLPGDKEKAKAVLNGCLTFRFRLNEIKEGLKKSDAGSLQGAADHAKVLADDFAQQREELSKNKNAGSLLHGFRNITPGRIWRRVNSSAQMAHKEKKRQRLEKMETFELELSVFSKAAAALADEMAVSAQTSPAGPGKLRRSNAFKRPKENRGSEMLQPKASVRANEGPEQAAVLTTEELVGLLNTSKVPSIAKEMEEEIEKSHNNRDHGSQSPVKTDGLSKELKTQPAPEKKPLEQKQSLRSPDKQPSIKAAQGHSSTEKTRPPRGSSRRGAVSLSKFEGIALAQRMERYGPDATLPVGLDDPGSLKPTRAKGLHDIPEE